MRRIAPFLLVAIVFTAACAGSGSSSNGASTPTPATPTPTNSATATPTATPSDPGAPGPLAVATSSATIPGAHSDSGAADIYVPGGTGPYPVVFLAHGFGRSKAQHVGNGQHLASWGFITVVPNLPHATDHAKNGEDLVAFANWAKTNPPELGGSIADTSKIAVAGHSAGGLASTLASQGTSPFSLLVGLDPVDASSLGVTAAPSVSIATAYVIGEPSSCNANGNSVDMWNAIAATTKERLRVVNATHCDFEDPTDGTCTTFCGTWDATRHATARRYLTAWLLDRLAGHHEFAPWTMGGAQMTADANAGVIADVTHAP